MGDIIERAFEQTDSAIDLARRVIQMAEEVLAQRDQLEEELAMYRDGYQGSCAACEPVGERNVQLEAEIRRLVEAIRRHRRDIWGECEIDHPEDVALYAAMEATNE